jgi:hypothetical protein
MWFLFASILSFPVPENGPCVSMFHGIFGRLYIFYFCLRYNQMITDWFKGVCEAWAAIA